MKKKFQRSTERHSFLQKSGLKGGGLNLLQAILDKTLPERPPVSSRLEVPKGIGKGQHVVILGAGVAGLATAYELLKHKETHYTVTILEAADRVGGRSLTLRPGDSFTEVAGDEVYTQTCDFTEESGQPYPPYLNAGPGRIPSSHINVLNFCKELNVELQVYVMESRSNLVYAEGIFDQRQRINRRIGFDTRGYIATYLYHSLDQVEDLDQNEKKQFQSLLISFGNLTSDGSYTGVNDSGYPRSGYEILPGVHEPGTPEKPLKFSDLLSSAFWQLSFYQPDDMLWQQTSFQPVGGMDMIEKALEREIKAMGGEIRLNSPVTKVRRAGNRFLISYDNQGTEVSVKGDYCISNMPIPFLEKIIDIKEFSEDYAQALLNVFATPCFLQPTCKVGWQAERKWWQNPNEVSGNPNSEHQIIPIFGGISWTSDEMVQMWYPSDNYHGQYGVLTGAYNYSQNAAKWGTWSPEKRLEAAREGAANLHGPEFANALGKGLSIAWQNIPTQKGGWASWKDVPDSTDSYNALLEGDNGFFVIGDQVSHVIGWKEGAVASALNVFAQVTEVEDYFVPFVRSVPNTEALVQGHFRA